MREEHMQDGWKIVSSIPCFASPYLASIPCFLLPDLPLPCLHATNMQNSSSSLSRRWATTLAPAMNLEEAREEEGEEERQEEEQRAEEW